MIRILFCNISYLLYYNTRLDRVAPKNGGAYVAKMHDAYEKHNFDHVPLREGEQRLVRTTLYILKELILSQRERHILMMFWLSSVPSLKTVKQ